MTSLQLLEGIGEIKSEFILEARRQGKAKVSWKRTALIAAIVALMLLLVGCVAVLLGLGELSLGRGSYDAGFGETIQVEQLSMQGYLGSPGYQAALEWQDFLSGYDQDGELMRKADANRDYPPIDYMSYLCYTDEMREKIDSLCEKYGLEILGPVYTPMSPEGWPEYSLLLPNLGMEPVVREPGIMEEYGSGSYFRGGSFQLGVDFRLHGELVKVHYRCIMKDAFDGVTFGISSVEDYTQWEYVTEEGAAVQLALGPELALAIADRERCFITAIIKTEGGLDQAELTEIARCLRFDQIPQAPALDSLIDPPWFDAPQETEYQETAAPETEPQKEEAQKEEPQKSQQEAPAALVDDPLMDYLIDTIKSQGAKTPEESGLWFTQRDFDGDNTGELLLGWGPGKDENLHELVTVQDGKVTVLLSGDSFWLCEGNIWERQTYIASTRYIDYYRIENGEAVLVECLMEIPEGENQGWAWSETGGAAQWNWTAVTEEEAAAIQAKYPRMDPYLNPLADFPQLDTCWKAQEE